jgi:hypothetical protein
MITIVWLIVVTAHLCFALFAVTSMGKLAHSMSVLRAARWTALIALLPVAGSVLWLRVGEPRVKRESGKESSDSTQ